MLRRTRFQHRWPAQTDVLSSRQQEVHGENSTQCSRCRDLDSREVIALPDLQRPFVWEDTKVRDLLDSLFVGFPVGTLVFWHTSNDKDARALGAERPGLRATESSGFSLPSARSHLSVTRSRTSARLIATAFFAQLSHVSTCWRCCKGRNESGIADGNT
jgi:hypothetical protein